MERSLLWRLGFALWTVVAERLDRWIRWYRVPSTALSLAVLLGIRNRLRERNLIGTSLGLPREGAARSPSVGIPACRRTADGTFNDLGFPTMGAAGTPLGRNMLINLGAEDPNLLRPNPRLISQKLLARNGVMAPAGPLNLLAAAWIQFMIHDWFSHGPTRTLTPGDGSIEIPPEPGGSWGDKTMRVPRTLPDRTHPPCTAREPRTFLNTVTHWWDGSQLYGSDQATQDKLRTRTNGHLRMEKGLLPLEPDPVDRRRRIEVSGFTENWWIGLSLMHTVFALEHNAICDELSRLHPRWTDEDLFAHARLINVALMAKIHTLEWTPAILANPAVERGMRGSWEGLERQGGVYRWFGLLAGEEARRGILGSPTEHFGIPYSMTEEFVSVYRMHPLMPDELNFHSVTGPCGTTKRLLEVAFDKSRIVLEPPPLGLDLGMDDVAYSFGLMPAGAITLHNYPDSLRNLTLPNGVALDLAAVEILRDRERGVPRYNDFRERLNLPRVASFEELVGKRPERRKWARELEEVYGNVDAVDVMVGLLAEEPPPGFGFSDTAFRIFILMASRRLKSDRFFTDDYRDQIYTPEGREWIDQSTFKDILRRNLSRSGGLEKKLRDVEQVFWRWGDPPNCARTAP
jgi:Animal haem peroxidase